MHYRAFCYICIATIRYNYDHISDRAIETISFHILVVDFAITFAFDGINKAEQTKRVKIGNINTNSKQANMRYHIPDGIPLTDARLIPNNPLNFLFSSSTVICGAVRRLRYPAGERAFLSLVTQSPLGRMLKRSPDDVTHSPNGYPSLDGSFFIASRLDKNV